MDNNRQKNVQTVAVHVDSQNVTGFGFVAYTNSRVEKR